MRYTKPWMGLADQVAQLQGRGLQIGDPQRAMDLLQVIGYYRLTPYCLVFKDPQKRFRVGTTLDAVIDLYNFDRDLRLVILEAISHIEIALRADLTHVLARELGPIGYATNPASFKSFDHVGFMEELERAEAASSNEKFVTHFRAKYYSENHLPIWMAAELMSFGTLSRLYAAAPANARKSFASRLNATTTFVESWMRSLSYVRNVSAHHSRLWNRVLRVMPSIPLKSPAWPYEVIRGGVPGSDRVYPVLVVIRHCLLRVAPTCTWRDRLFALFDKYPGVPLEAMSIPEGWRERSPWITP